MDALLCYFLPFLPIRIIDLKVKILIHYGGNLKQLLSTNYYDWVFVSVNFSISLRSNVFNYES